MAPKCGRFGRSVVLIHEITLMYVRLTQHITFFVKFSFFHCGLLIDLIFAVIVSDFQSCINMDLTKEGSHKTLQGKRTASDDSCGEDVKKMKFSGAAASTIYDPVTDSKENIPEMPLDMSRGSKNGTADVEWRSQSVNSSVRILREKLRNEETALLLLRKLQQSQLSVAARSGLSLIGSNIRQNHVVTNNVNVVSQSNIAGRMFAKQQFTNHIAPQNSSVQHVDARQQEVNRQVQAHKQMLVNGTTTLKESNVRPQPPRPPAAVQQTHEQTLAQRQALAKLAIRRQLEATLLQLPMPKCIPQEMLFIPTIGFYADFVALVGMEEAIACILDEEDSTKVAAEAEKLQPLQCARCQTDVTPQWKPEEQGAKNVICEQCAMKSRKQAFRQEHTSRLMAAFHQALQQERKIELDGAASGVVA